MQRLDLQILLLILVLIATPSSILPQDWAPGEEELFDRFQELRDARRYSEAISVVEKWIKFCVQHYGDEHLRTGSAFDNLGILYQDLGQPSKAEGYLLKSFSILQKTLPSDHEHFAITHANLGLLYEDMGDFSRAELHFLQSLEVSRKITPPNPPEFATTLNNLGNIYFHIGKLPKAEELYLQCLEIRKNSLPPDHPAIGTSLNNLGALYHKLGLFSKAEKLLLQCLDIRKGNVPRDDLAIATTLNNLGSIYKALGELTKAEQHLLKSLEFYQNSLPMSHLRMAIPYNNLGGFYMTVQDYTRAGENYRKSLDIFREALPPEHPHIGTSLNNLGVLCLATGDLPNSEQYYIKCLEVFRKSLPADHLSIATPLGSLAFCQHSLGKTEEAIAKATEADRIALANWIKALSFTSEREREAYHDRLLPFNLFGTLGDGPIAFKASLWRKSSLLEASLQDKRAALAAEADPALANQLRKAESLKDQLRQASLEGNKANISEDEIQQLNAQLDDLQKTIAHTVAGYGSLRQSLQITLEQVQAAIPASSALVDFIHYSHNLGQDKWEKRYAAVILPPSADPVFISLGKAEDLDALITRHREISGTDPNKANVAELDPVLHKVCRQLHQAIAVPIEAALPADTRELILCPDAQLHFLAFASLLDEQDRFWVEKFSLRHIATARDLLMRPKVQSATGVKEIVLVGDPDLRDTTPLRLMADPKALEDAERQHQEWVLAHTQAQQPSLSRGANLSQLPGAYTESLALQARFQNAGWKTHLLTKEKAAEPALMQTVNSPLVLHLAMHGRFQDEIDLGQEKRRQRGLEMLGEENQRQQVELKNPMNGSYLALAAAQTTLEQWSRGKVPPLRHDGVLTAAEVASLNLEGTLLVTLSACETGLGRAQSGEGVLGLQRGFALAGAENLLLTLWQIGDGSTGEFMKRFYDRLLTGEHPAHILPQVQREMLVELREKKGLWKAVNAAAPFTLMSRTAVPPQR